MYKFTLAFFYSFFLYSITFAQSIHHTSTLGVSSVSLTNNTEKTIVIDTTLITGDPYFEQGRDWEGFAGILHAYETKKILWFSRDANVLANELYRFDVFARAQPDTGETVDLRFYLKGKPLFGSEISTELSLPRLETRRLFAQDGLEQYAASFWQTAKVVFARSWLPLGHIFNDFHFVINQVEEAPINTPTAKQITVLSYNTQLLPFYARAVDDLNQPDVRAQAIPPYIKGFDVVILEELFDRDLRNTVINAMSDNYPYHTNVVGNNTSNVLTGGVMIFSKWPITNEIQTVYANSAGMDSLAAKGAIYAAIDKGGKRYHIIGTHLQADRNSASRDARLGQIRELTSFIDRLQIPVNEPLLLGGDFNIDQNSEELYSLLSSLHVSLLENKGYLYSIDPSINTMSVDTNKSRLDYVFYSLAHEKPSYAYNKIFILRDLAREKLWPKFDLSDHFPVQGYFDFN